MRMIVRAAAPIAAAAAPIAAAAAPIAAGCWIDSRSIPIAFLRCCSPSIPSASGWVCPCAKGLASEGTSGALRLRLRRRSDNSIKADAHCIRERRRALSPVRRERLGFAELGAE